MDAQNKKRIDVVYIYKQNGNGDELKHSLRSLCNLTDFNGRVFVVGDSHSWFSSKITHIPSPSKSRNQYIDAEDKWLKALHDERVSDDFIAMNDDMYITKKTSLPVMHQGYIKDNLSRISTHTMALKHTGEYLDQQGIDEPLSYAGHVPMLMNKKKRLEVSRIVRPTLSTSKALLARTVYGNLYNVGGEYYEDKKARNRNLIDGTFISTQYYTPQLAKLFPNRSEYELPHPPIVHMIWIGSPIPLKYRRNILSYKNKGYQVKLWTQPPKLINQELYDRAKSYALKADIMRLEILYQYGGIYTDVDSICLRQLPLGSDLVCTTSASGYIANETIYADKGHPALREAIESLQDNVNSLDTCNIWDIAGATYITPIFTKYSHNKLNHNIVGRRGARHIVHQYDGSWAKGIVKSEKKPLSFWMEV